MSIIIPDVWRVRIPGCPLGMRYNQSIADSGKYLSILLVDNFRLKYSLKEISKICHGNCLVRTSADFICHGIGFFI